jgi:hypothetical protein
MSSRWASFVLVCIVSLMIMVLIWWLPHVVPALRKHEPPKAGALPALDRLVAWRNGGPLTPDSLQGHPVAVLLWSDTDPRGLAGLAIADAWHRAYAPLGARVVAIHVPEYDFATDTSVALGIARQQGLALTMADDPSGFIAGALGGGPAGPHLVIAAPDGHVVLDTIDDLSAGQGALEAMVRAAHPGLALPPSPDASLPRGVRVVDLGVGKVEEGPLRGEPAGRERVFTAEFRYQVQGHAWAPYPVGGWKSSTQGITATRGGAANYVAIRYSAERAGVVVTPPPGATARLWILRDDRWPLPDERGDDVAADERGAASVVVTGPRLYWIDRGAGERVLKLSPDAPGVTLNAFVFAGAHE